jgi:hypothetical protein
MFFVRQLWESEHFCEYFFGVITGALRHLFQPAGNL